MAPSTYQPLPKSSMDIPDEKSIDAFRLHADDCACSRQQGQAEGHEHGHVQCTRHQHRACHNERRRRALRIAGACAAGMVLTALALMSLNDGVCLGNLGLGFANGTSVGDDDSLWKRQNQDTSTGGQQTVFVRNRCK